MPETYETVYKQREEAWKRIDELEIEKAELCDFMKNLIDEIYELYERMAYVKKGKKNAK